MKNYLFHNQEFPAHFSIGAVVINDQNKVMCHYFKKIYEFEEIYLVMRESPEQNESVEQTLRRGLMEELGTKAEIIHYLGSIVSTHADDTIAKIEKTTLYFLCQLKEFNVENRSKDDPESSSEILFMDVDELIAKSQDQGMRYKDRTDFDESKVLLKLKKYLKNL